MRGQILQNFKTRKPDYNYPNPTKTQRYKPEPDPNSSTRTRLWLPEPITTRFTREKRPQINFSHQKSVEIIQLSKSLEEWLIRLEISK